MISIKLKLLLIFCSIRCVIGYTAVPYMSLATLEPAIRLITPNSSMTMNGTLLNTPTASKRRICHHWRQLVALVKRGTVRGRCKGVVTAGAAAWALFLPNQRLPVPARCGLNSSTVAMNSTAVIHSHSRRLASRKPENGGKMVFDSDEVK